MSFKYNININVGIFKNNKININVIEQQLLKELKKFGEITISTKLSSSKKYNLTPKRKQSPLSVLRFILNNYSIPYLTIISDPRKNGKATSCKIVGVKLSHEQVKNINKLMLKYGFENIFSNFPTNLDKTLYSHWGTRLTFKKIH